jgi:hypothetical protein
LQTLYRTEFILKNNQYEYLGWICCFLRALKSSPYSARLTNQLRIIKMALMSVQHSRYHTATLDTTTFLSVLRSQWKVSQSQWDSAKVHLPNHWLRPPSQATDLGKHYKKQVTKITNSLQQWLLYTKFGKKANGNNILFWSSKVSMRAKPCITRIYPQCWNWKSLH